MKNALRKISTLGASVSAGLLTVVSAVQAQGVDIAPINPGQGFFDDVGVLINGLLSFVMVLAALLVFMYLIWGGIEWITSGGDKGKTESARNKITSAVIGLIVLAASYAILLLVLSFLGFGSLNDVFDNIKPVAN